MRRDQPTTPFDVEAEDLTQQFWGTGKGWVSSEQPAVRSRAARAPRRDDTTGSLRVIREGLAAFRPQTSPNATGEVRRVRQHGAPSRSQPDHEPRREATLGELAAGRADVGGWADDDVFDDDLLPVAPQRSRHGASDRAADVDVPLTPMQPLVDRLGLGAVDPLLVRAGAIVMALLLLVPVVMSLRPDQDDSLPGDVVEAPQPVVAGAAPGPTPEAALAPAVSPVAVAAPVEAATSTAAPTESSAPSESAGTTSSEPAAQELVTTSGEATETAVASADEAAAVDVAAERIVPTCPQTYTAAPGDSWYRIADEAGISPTELLAENNATTDTVILPGDDVCLPEGAAMPSPPTTTAPTTAPDDESTTTPAPVTTTAPTTTAPTTTVAPVANLSRTEVQELIRQTWPEEEVDKALAVARRESNFIATADNGWCCVGVFQLYWTVHRGWLDDFGITQRSDLFDARKNIAAAYHMWQNQGWGPWGG